MSYRQLGVIVIIGLGLVGPIKAEDRPVPPPPSVIVKAVSVDAISGRRELVGRVEAIEQVELIARVEGFLEKRLATDGEQVEIDQELFLIESAEYEADLLTAEASLASAKASFNEAQRVLKRRDNLRKQDAVTQASYEEALSNRDQAAATVKSAQADVRQAKLRLSYTKIHSPIKGRIGKVDYSVGSLVNANSGALATVTQIDPIRVVFGVSDRDYVETRLSVGHDLSNEEINRRFIPTVVLPDGEEYDQKGFIRFIDTQINPRTGTLSVWAEFPNPTAALLPGQSIKVRVRRTAENRFPVVSKAAVQRDRDGSLVFVVNQENTVIKRRIKTGIELEDAWSIESGLEEGELVIIEGLQKVKPGAKVNPVFAITEQEP